MTLTESRGWVVRLVSLVVFTLVMSACQNNQGTSTSSRTPTPVKPAMAPGSIHLTIQIGDCMERLNNARSPIFDCDAMVLSVQEYGAGTTQLPSSTRIRISFRDSLLTEGKDNALKSGSELSLIIQSTRNSNTSDTIPEWDAVLLN